MGCLENDRKYAGKWFVNSLAQFLVNFFTRLRAAFFLNHFQQQICIVVGLVNLLARARALMVASKVSENMIMVLSA